VKAIVVVVFKISHRPDLPVAEYEETGARMVELVSQIPGFLGMDYAEIDGGELLVARFESHEALEAWRKQPEHEAAQRRGRERFFQHYSIDVCESVRSYDFEAPSEEPGGNAVKPDRPNAGD
jgi:heme-degrading monooxygenase HmoA